MNFVNIFIAFCFISTNGLAKRSSPYFGLLPF